MVNYNWPAFATLFVVPITVLYSDVFSPSLTFLTVPPTWNLLFISPCMVRELRTLLNVDSCFPRLCFIFELEIQISSEWNLNLQNYDNIITEESVSGLTNIMCKVNVWFFPHSFHLISVTMHLLVSAACPLT